MSVIINNMSIKHNHKDVIKQATTFQLNKIIKMLLSR